MHHSLRILVRIILFVLLLEGFLSFGGWAFLLVQEYHNRGNVLTGGEYRIMCLGDSITAHGGRDSYPNRLQYALNDMQHSIRFKVINKGVPSWTTSQMSYHLEEFLRQYHPNMIILMVGVNDDAFYTIAATGLKARIKFLLLDRIKVYRLAKNLVKKASGSLRGPTSQETAVQPEQDEELAPTEAGIALGGVHGQDTTDGPALPKHYRDIVRYHPLTIRNYNDMAEAALKKGTKVIAMQYPMADAAPLKDIIYLKRRVIFVDNGALFKDAVRKEGVKQYFEDDYGHLTLAGKELLVRHLSKSILEALNIRFGGT